MMYFKFSTLLLLPVTGWDPLQVCAQLFSWLGEQLENCPPQRVCLMMRRMQTNLKVIWLEWWSYCLRWMKCSLGFGYYGVDDWSGTLWVYLNAWLLWIGVTLEMNTLILVASTFGLDCCRWERAGGFWISVRNLTLIDWR